jgi:urease accessory protein
LTEPHAPAGDAASAAALLAALQLGDGQFPGGGFAFSWGLESLIADAELSREGWAAFVEGQLRGRWAGADRVLVAHAHAAARDADCGRAIDALRELDALAEASTIAEAARIGSRRAGRALLGTHARLDTPGAVALKAEVDAGRAHGHLAVVQGAVLAGSGLDERAALAVSAYAMASGLGTAAIRLGFVGHLDAQRALARLRPAIAALVAAPRPPLDALCTAVPLADVALMRHADRALRLFSN